MRILRDGKGTHKLRNPELRKRHAESEALFSNSASEATAGEGAERVTGTPTVTIPAGGGENQIKSTGENNQPVTCNT